MTECHHTNNTAIDTLISNFTLIYRTYYTILLPWGGEKPGPKLLVGLQVARPNQGEPGMARAHPGQVESLMREWSWLRGWPLCQTRHGACPCQKHMTVHARRENGCPPPQDQKWSMPIRAAFHSRYHLTTTIQKLEADVFFKCVRVPTAQGTDLGIRKTALHGPASSPNAERVRFVQGTT